MNVFRVLRRIDGSGLYNLGSGDLWSTTEANAYNETATHINLNRTVAKWSNEPNKACEVVNLVELTDDEIKLIELNRLQIEVGNDPLVCCRQIEDAISTLLTANKHLLNYLSARDSK